MKNDSKTGDPFLDDLIDHARDPQWLRSAALMYVARGESAADVRERNRGTKGERLFAPLAGAMDKLAAEGVTPGKAREMFLSE